MKTRQVWLSVFALGVLLAGSGLSVTAAHGLSTAFTYQGQLTQTGLPTNGSCDLQFGLFAGSSGGSALGTQTVPSVTVTNGLFTVQLNDSGQLGAGVFNGSDRWLEIQVRCPAGSGSYALLTPRQQLTAAPYSLFAPTAGVANDVSFNYAGSTSKGGAASNLSCSGCVDPGDIATGAVGTNQLGPGAVTGAKITVPLDLSGSGDHILSATNSASSGTGAVFQHSNTSGTAAAVEGDSASTAANAVGVLGQITSTTPGENSAAVQGINNGTSDNGIGVWGSHAGDGMGVYGSVSGSGIGVYGNNDGAGPGVAGLSAGSYGVVGASQIGAGVVGFAGGTGAPGLGVAGETFGTNGTGVYGIADSGTSARGVWGQSTEGIGGFFQHQGTTGTAAAVEGDSASTDDYAVGVLGTITSTTPGSSSAAVQGMNNGTSDYGIGVEGSQNGAGWGVYGTVTGDGLGVYGSAWGTGSDAVGVEGDVSGAGVGVEGWNGGSGPGVKAHSMGGIGVFAEGGLGGVYGQHSGSPPGADLGWLGANGKGVLGVGVTHGVFGESNSSGIGVYGQNDGSGPGVVGISATGYGVKGVSGGGSTGDAVRGEANGSSGTGVHGIANNGGAAFGVWGQSTSGYAGYFNGAVHISGNLTKTSGAFKIDHPLDPAHKYLQHSFVESPDMMNIYNGNITTDANGDATVTLPDYFTALNRDYRYQLTVIGTFAQAIVANEIENNQFAIKTDRPDVKVSWQVTGIRQDAYANAHRIQVEEQKPESDREHYLHPELFGAPADKTVGVSAKQ